VEQRILAINLDEKLYRELENLQVDAILKTSIKYINLVRRQK
jgi:hypothetical protein